MTLEELIIQAERFGGCVVIENRDLLISSANRALRELYLTIPVTKTVRFNARGHRPTTYYKEIVCGSGQSITIPIRGKAFSMRVMGNGNYTLNDNGSMTVSQFETGSETKLIRRFLSGDGSIRFWGSFTFTIYDLSLYDDIYGPEISDIPDGSPTTVYDIRAIYGDFLAFTTPPTDRYGSVIENCRLHDGLLEIDSGFSGEIVLTYRRMPLMIDGQYVTSDPYEIIDINDEYTHLLIYLTWYHYLSIDDEAKAGIYKKKFDDMVSALNENYRIIDSSYVNVNGWA